MADVNDFYGLGDLATFNQAVQQSDPYGLVARQLNSWTPDASTWSPMATGATSFGKAFLAGMLGNYARQNAADQMNAVVGVLPQLKANPMAVTAPEGVDADAFSVLKGNAILRNFQRQSEGGAEKAKIMQQLMGSVFGEAVKTGQLSVGDAAHALETGDYSKLGTNPIDPKKNPDSREYKVDQDIFKIEQNYTDKLLTGAEPQRVMAMNRAATNILKAIKQDDPLAASTAIFEYAKLQDPQGTVREADEMRVSDPGGPLGMLAQLHNKITGEGKLTDSAKKSMAQLVPMLQENAFREYNQLRDSYLDAAKSYGANPERIKYLKPADLSELLALPEATNPMSDVDSIVNRELARRGLGPDGLPLKAPLPTGPVRPY